MKERRLIAEALLDIANRSATSFINVSKEDKELINAAKKMGIVLPSPDLAVFKTVYAEIDKVNRNGIVLPRKAVEVGLPTLVGKQINFEHDGAGRICGYIIAASINEDKIETIGVIFKSLFNDEMDTIKERFENKELAVSFEIYNRNPETGESVLHHLDDDVHSIDPIFFHGEGLLLVHEPACPEAKVFKLMAKKEIESAEQIVDKVFSEDLIYASLAIEKIKSEKEEHIVDEVKINEQKDEAKVEDKIAEIKIEEPKVEEIAEIKSEETKPEEKSDGDETKSEKPEAEKSEVEELKKEEVKTEEAPAEEIAEEKKVEAQPEVKEEANTETPKAEEIKKAEDKVEEIPTVVDITTIETVTIIETPSDDGSKVERKGSRTVTRRYSDGKESVSTQDYEVVDTYTFAEMEAKIAEAKVELENKVTEKDNEITTLKTELDSKNQEIAALTPEVETKEEKEDLTVGSTETKDKYREIQEDVDRHAFPR